MIFLVKVNERSTSMQQMTITVKVQIVATDTDKVLLDETMSVYRDACNYVSDYVFYSKRKIWS